MPVVAVTGLRAEARLAARAGLAAICAGGDAARTAAALDRAIAQGASVLLSFGLAGGLAPALPPGTLIAASAVLGPAGERHTVDAAWQQGVCGVPGAVAGDILGGGAIAATALAKAALHAASGALAVDLESLIVARAADRRGLRCLVLRAIADPAGRDLPPAALIPLRPDGRPDLPPILASVLRRPAQIAGLAGLARDTQRALTALRRALAALRPLLAG